MNYGSAKSAEIVLSKYIFYVKNWHCHTPHCSYLNIYISQNIRLCKGDFEGKFQTILLAKVIIFFIWKFRFIIFIFPLVFAEFVKSAAFYTLQQQCAKSSGFDKFCKKQKENENNKSELSDRKIHTVDL